MTSSLFAYENDLHKKGYENIVGIDEAGRGACAGPLVVAGCILSADAETTLKGINDSKKITPQKREVFFSLIKESAVDFAIVEFSPEFIDEVGVHKANILGFSEVVQKLKIKPDLAVLDGFKVKDFPVEQISLIKADAKVAAVAAASILAKVYRDKLMLEYDKEYPQYNFGKHKGYITALHANNLELYGPCAIHRYSYKNVAKLTKG